MSILLIIVLAKLNDRFRRPWLFAAGYVVAGLLLELLTSTSVNFGSIFLSAGLSFAGVGLLFTLLLRFEDNLPIWLVTLGAGLFVLCGGPWLFYLWLQQ